MQDQDDSQQIFFVVLECGAAWPHDLDCRGLTDVRVVAQQMDEPSSAFLARVQARLGRTTREGAKIVAAMFVLNGRLAYADLTARVAIARALAFSLPPAESCELFIRGGSASVEWRGHVLALAHALEEEVPSRVKIQTEFDRSRSSSPMAKTSGSGFFSAVRSDDLAARKVG